VSTFSSGFGKVGVSTGHTTLQRFWCESSADPGEGDLLKSGEKGKRSGLNGWTIESWIEVRAGQNRLLGAGYGMSSQIR